MKKSVLAVGLSIVMLAACSEKETTTTTQEKATIQAEKEVAELKITKETENPSMKSFKRRAAVIKEDFDGIITEIKLDQVDNVDHVIITVDKVTLSKASEDMQKNFGYRSRTKVKDAVANSGLQEYSKTIVKYFSAESQEEMIFE
ncbi:hypothetical protein OF830_28145 [Bacillus paramycoides]|uniref:hypothetical protein n=1 Tax=Bacillus paramycoides TaxID=2026194 RepID=UPI002243A1AC|nr:hypothetical protein [Bacillus paramycoides]MCW9134626.1 hypothetical protein [Bacillus paramycoides]